MPDILGLVSRVFGMEMVTLSWANNPTDYTDHTTRTRTPPHTHTHNPTHNTPSIRSWTQAWEDWANQSRLTHTHTHSHTHTHTHKHTLFFSLSQLQSLPSAF